MMKSLNSASKKFMAAVLAHIHLYLGNFTLLLTSSGQEWQFHIATDVVVKNDNFTLLLTCSGQEWQFHIATDVVVKNGKFHIATDVVDKNGNFTLVLTSSGQEWQLVDRPQDLQADLPPKCIMGYILLDVFGSHFGFFKKRWEFPVISE